MARMATESKGDFMKPISVTEKEFAIISHGTPLTSVSEVKGKSKISQGDAREVRAFPTTDPMGGQAFMACEKTSLTANALWKTVTTLEERGGSSAIRAGGIGRQCLVLEYTFKIQIGAIVKPVLHHLILPLFIPVISVQRERWHDNTFPLRPVVGLRVTPSAEWTGFRLITSFAGCGSPSSISASVNSVVTASHA
jgi:hypothetical protein